MAENNDSASIDEYATPTGFSTPPEEFTLAVDPNILSTKLSQVEHTQTQHAADIEKESDTSKEQEKHLMFSYSWKHQEIVLKINDRLKKLGYRIWIDTEQMSGSTLECMAEAVENSEIVLMCLSRAYKESENCKIEGEYVCSKKIPFIPLLVESGYKADGWLGALLGTKLYIDFSQAEKFETKFAELVRAIDRKFPALKRNSMPSSTSEYQSEQPMSTAAVKGHTETQNALPLAVSQELQGQEAPAQSEVVVSGGNFHGAVLGPQTKKKFVQGNDYRNAKITHIHHHYGEDKQDSAASSTSSSEISTEKEMKSSQIEEEYMQLTEDIFMYNKKPLREGARIYEGYQQHASGVRRPLAIKMVVPCSEAHVKEVHHLVNLGSHPNLIQIVHSKVTRGTPRVLYIAMELCSSQNLQDYLDENREQNLPFDFKKTMSFSKQLVSSMVHIHRHKIIHRDIKPENILLSADGNQLKVTDFGLGKQLRPGRSVTEVRAGAQGTYGYIAPEMYKNGKISPRSDVFSLGITFHNLYTNGKHPFGADTDLLVHNIKKNKGHDFSGLLIYGRKKDEFLDLIGKMLQHDPKLRPTMQEVADHPFFKDDPYPVTSGQANIGTSGPENTKEDLSAVGSDTLTLALAKALASQVKYTESSPESSESSFDDTSCWELENLDAVAIEESARQLLKESKFSEVISLLKDLPPSKDQQTMLAECYFRTEEWDKAKKSMDALKAIMAPQALCVPSRHPDADSQGSQENIFQESDLESVSSEQLETASSIESSSATFESKTEPKKEMQVKTTPTKVDEKVKIVLVGDGATGKSYLIDRFMTDEYSNYYYGTVFDDYKAVVEVDGKKVELAIFDTAGVEDFDRLRPLSYPDTDAALICFQVREEHSETDTLGNIAEKWLPEIRAHLPKVPIILVGNKKDLRDDPETLRKLQPGAEKPVTTEEGQAIAKKLGAKLYLECSAKTGVGVQEVFEQAARVALTARAASAKKRKKKSKPTCPVS